MNYSINPSDVRVDFFKESGKWYQTLVIEWLYWSKDTQIHDALIYSLHAKIGICNGEMTIVCLDPYHEYSFPLMIKNWGDRARELGLS